MRTILLGGIALSIGWGVRGNWGHEYGAMIPGALAALAVALLSGREEWQNRAAFFAFFGALGWSFGGSMSYMRVLAYTHSASPLDILYGYACIFVIGFLWGAMGGAGTALPAVLSRERLVEFLPPLIVIFSVWEAWELFAPKAWNVNWYDSDWQGTLLALAGLLAYAAIARRFTPACSLILHMIGGWWAGFVGLVVVCGIRMTPPRGDNWAGCVGMTAAMLFWLFRNRLGSVARAALVSGFFAGFGFCTANLIKLFGIATGAVTNWHSVLEQSYGFIQGVGIAIAMSLPELRARREAEDAPEHTWAERFCVFFVLIVITYVNIVKNLNVWRAGKIVPESFYGLPAAAWFHIAYALLALTLVLLMIRHGREPIAALPETALGRGQILFVVFLWWIVIGNLARTVPFAPQRIVTEGVIFVNACLATLLILCAPRPLLPIRLPLRRIVAAGLIAFVLTVAVETAATVPLFKEPLQGAKFRFGAKALEGW